MIHNSNVVLHHCFESSSKNWPRLCYLKNLIHSNTDEIMRWYQADIWNNNEKLEANLTDSNDM